MYSRKRKYDLGYHGGRKTSQHGNFDGMGHRVLDEKENAEKYFEMVTEIVIKYKNDERIIIWNVYNEPERNKRAILC